MLKSTFKALLCASLVITTACGKQSPGGDERTPVALSTLPLPTLDASEGIYPSLAVLKDVHNPFKSAIAGDDIKWPVAGWAEADPTTRTAARFYFWATYLAKGPDGSRQFQVGRALAALSTLESVDEAARAKYKVAAIAAYQAILDYFPDSLDYDAQGNPYRVAPGAYIEILNLGGKPQGNWIILPGFGGGITVVPG